MPNGKAISRILSLNFADLVIAPLHRVSRKDLSIAFVVFRRRARRFALLSVAGNISLMLPACSRVIYADDGRARSDIVSSPWQCRNMIEDVDHVRNTGQEIRGAVLGTYKRLQSERMVPLPNTGSADISDEITPLSRRVARDDLIVAIQAADFHHLPQSGEQTELFACKLGEKQFRRDIAVATFNFTANNDAWQHTEILICSTIA